MAHNHSHNIPASAEIKRLLLIGIGVNVISVTIEEWETTITTEEFGTKTEAEAFGRIISQCRIPRGYSWQLSINTKQIKIKLQ